MISMYTQARKLAAASDQTFFVHHALRRAMQVLKFCETF